jgi:hypothetical protein
MDTKRRSALAAAGFALATFTKATVSSFVKSLTTTHVPDVRPWRNQANSVTSESLPSQVLVLPAGWVMGVKLDGEVICLSVGHARLNHHATIQIPSKMAMEKGTTVDLSDLMRVAMDITTS